VLGHILFGHPFDRFAQSLIQIDNDDQVGAAGNEGEKPPFILASAYPNSLPVKCPGHRPTKRTFPLGVGSGMAIYLLRLHVGAAAVEGHIRDGQVVLAHKVFSLTHGELRFVLVVATGQGQELLKLIDEFLI